MLPKALVVVWLFVGGFSLAGNAGATVQKGYATTDTPSGTSVNAFSFGGQFVVNAASVLVNGVQFYQASGEASGAHTVKLWDSGCTQLATATASTAPGWNEINFAAPVQLTNGSAYRVSYSANTVGAQNSGALNRGIGSLGTLNQARTGTAGNCPGSAVTADYFVGPLLDVQTTATTTTTVATTVTTTATTTVAGEYLGPTSGHFDTKLDEQTAAVVGAVNSASSDASSHADLIWWGAWFTAGILVVGLIVAPAWRELFPWSRSGGNI